MRYLDPSIDYVFKILFKDPGDEQRLIAMLTAILEPSSPIVSAKVLNPQIPPDVATAKSIVLDVLVALDDGRAIDIEMETWPRPVFIARDLFYWARAHAMQLDAGENYADLRPTISIAWLADPRDGSRSFLPSPRLHTRYRICDVVTKRELTDHLEMHFLDLRKLRTDDMLSPALRRWAEFFDHPTEATLARLAEEDPIMADTIKKLENVSAHDENFFIAEARFKGEVRRRTDLAYERKEGREEGLAEGRKEGLAKGREEGRAEGSASAMAESVVAVLEARFGAVPPEVRSAIEAADLATRRTMLARAATVAYLAEFLKG